MPNPLTWTREAPTTPGWYWVGAHGVAGHIVCVQDASGKPIGSDVWEHGEPHPEGTLGVRGSFGWYAVSEYKGVWAGPIPELTGDGDE